MCFPVHVSFLKPLALILVYQIALLFMRGELGEAATS